METLNWQDQKWLGTVWSHSSTAQTLPSTALKKNLIDTIGSDWASVDFSLLFSLLFLGSRFQGKKLRERKRRRRRRRGGGGGGGGWEMLHYRKLIHKTTPLFFSDKTSVAKGQGDLHGEASKEKDTGWKWKDMRSTPLCHSPPSTRSIDFHKKDGMQFLSGEYTQTIWSKGRLKKGGSQAAPCISASAVAQTESITTQQAKLN